MLVRDLGRRHVDSNGNWGIAGELVAQLPEFGWNLGEIWWDWSRLKFWQVAWYKDIWYMTTLRPAASSSRLLWAWWWDTTGSRTGMFDDVLSKEMVRGSQICLRSTSRLVFSNYCRLFLERWSESGTATIRKQQPLHLVSRTFASSRRCKTSFCSDCTKARGARPQDSGRFWRLGVVNVHRKTIGKP